MSTMLLALGNARYRLSEKWNATKQEWESQFRHPSSPELERFERSEVGGWPWLGVVNRLTWGMGRGYHSDRYRGSDQGRTVFVLARKLFTRCPLRPSQIREFHCAKHGPPASIFFVVPFVVGDLILQRSECS